MKKKKKNVNKNKIFQRRFPARADPPWTTRLRPCPRRYLLIFRFFEYGPRARITYYYTMYTYPRIYAHDERTRNVDNEGGFDFGKKRNT